MINAKNDRENTIIRNILSGNNACGTLAAAVTNADGEYFRACVAPVVDAYEEEAAALRRQRQEALDIAEKRRQALEYLLDNLAVPVSMFPVIEPALGRPLR